MRITIAKSAGFCFGVRRAVDVAFQTAQTSPKVRMLGDIVHNELVVSRLQASGIKKIKKLSPGKDSTLLIRAHGSSTKTFEKAKVFGYRIVDATCPMVKEIHKIAKGCERKGFSIIIIGEKKHDEVQGIIGQLKKKAIVIEDVKDISLNKISRIKKAACIAQSTQDLAKASQIVNILNRI